MKPRPIIEEIQTALEAANERYAAARQEGQQLTLMLLALAARKAFPDATAILLDQSDQGDFADISHVEATEGAGFNRRLDEFREEYLTTAWNLDTSGWTEWTTFCDPEHEARWQWRLLIDPVLEYDGDFNRRIADLMAAQGKEKT